MSRRPVLIVEDDQDIRESLLELLLDEGYPVEEAKNGKDALDYLKTTRNRPGLILLDLMMPVMNGQVFLSYLEQENISGLNSIPVIVLTAAGDVVRSKVSGSLKKPIEVDRLLDAVKQFCGA